MKKGYPAALPCTVVRGAVIGTCIAFAIECPYQTVAAGYAHCYQYNLTLDID